MDMRAGVVGNGFQALMVVNMEQYAMSLRPDCYRALALGVLVVTIVLQGVEALVSRFFDFFAVWGWRPTVAASVRRRKLRDRSDGVER